METKTLELYLQRDYPIMLERVGGEYEAWHPDFGRGTMFVRGKTIREAIRLLDAFRRDLIRTYYERGVAIPEPSKRGKQPYSGQFLLRIPRDLHAQLARTAKRNGVSMNAYITHLLSQRSAIETHTEELERAHRTQTDSQAVLERIPYLGWDGLRNIRAGQLASGRDVENDEMGLPPTPEGLEEDYSLVA